MRRGSKILGWTVAVLIAVPLLLVAAVLLVGNIAPGRRLIETLAPRISGGMVRIEGLAGRFPDAIQVDMVTVSDANGVWLTVHDAALDWSPRRLVEGEVAIDRLEAQSVILDRLPAATGGETSVSIPPPRGVLSRLSVARLEIAPPVAGQPIAVAVQGAGEVLARDTGDAHLAITALTPRGGAPPDHYLLAMSVDPAHLHATLNVEESPRGLISELAGLPDLGSITIAASADGPPGALVTQATITAGQLRGDIAGTVDAAAGNGDLTFSADAPAMTPRPGVGWSSIRLDGNVHGPLAAPAANGTLAADQLTAAGAAIGSLRANLAGDATGKTKIQATIDQVRVPGPSPDVLAGGPLTLDSTVELANASRPFRFSLRHKLFSAEGTGDADRGQIHLTVPDLAPLAALGGIDLQGHTELDVGAARSAHGLDLTVNGGLGITNGIRPVPMLIGDTATIGLAVSVSGEDVTVSRFALHGTGFTATASGQFVNQVLNADWTLALNDLTQVQPGLAGAIEARGHVGGSMASMSVAGNVTGNLAARGQQLRQVTAHFAADGLPNAPEGRLTVGGTLLDAPVDVAIGAERRNGRFHFVIDRASWKSLAAGGMLDLAQGEALPTGTMTLSVKRLADLTPILGQPLAGDVTASLDSSRNAARLKAVVSGAAVPAFGSLAKAALDATITDPSGKAVIDGGLTLDGVQAGSARASARLTAKGPLDGLDLSLDAESSNVGELPARLAGTGRLNGSAETLSLASLRAAWGSETVRLLGPASIGFAQGIAVDRLRLGFRQGELTVSGRWGGGAAGTGLTATLVNLPADIVGAVAPAYAADGTISGEARLTGSPARPEGTIRVAASGLRLRTGPGRALPAAVASVNATLRGTDARVDAKLSAGNSSVTLAGTVPLSTDRGMDARVGGSVDLAMLDPLLAAQGRNVRGRLDLSMGLGGTPVSPKASGSVRVSGGAYQDASLGVHLTSIGGTALVQGDTIRLEQVSATAGPGTISLAGTVTIAAAPSVDVSLRASNARILSTDLATALVDADLMLRGALNASPRLAGTVVARSANIQVPERLPPSIVVIPVREAGAPVVRAPPSAPPPDIALNLTLDAPSRIYVRGRGLDAELGGRVVFSGTASAPVPQGALRLRRGTFSIVGQTLNLTSGTIDFAGGPLTNPTLNLVATSTSAAMTATLTVTGDVRDPKIVLSSVPDLPQDEILSQLLFNTSKARLSPFQVAEIAAALASLSGVAPGIGDPLGRVRSALGLDQLSVGSGASGGTTLQAGRYLAPGVRLSATQSASEGGSQATVEIEVAKGLKLETTVGTGSASATPGVGGNTNGSGVGLLYQFEY
jgi:translocation and assembly module TamB